MKKSLKFASFEIFAVVVNGSKVLFHALGIVRVLLHWPLGFISGFLLSKPQAA